MAYGIAQIAYLAFGCKITDVIGPLSYGRQCAADVYVAFHTLGASGTATSKKPCTLVKFPSSAT